MIIMDIQMATACIALSEFGGLQTTVHLARSEVGLGLAVGVKRHQFGMRGRRRRPRAV
jgi:hypothetical protein